MPGNAGQLTLYRNLRSIAEWIEANKELPPLQTTDAFVTFSIEIMNRALYLLRTGVALAPYGTQDRGLARGHAIVAGHMVRLMKLYDCFLMHACKDHLEICMIFFRLLLETVARIEYLLEAKRSTFRNFVLISYRPEKEQLADLQHKAKQRPLIPIERRILKSVRGHLRLDGVRQEALLQNRSWDLDGKNFRILLRQTGFEDWGYSYLFGSASHFVHGDWRDLTMHHLERRGGRYFPRPEYRATDPRPTCAATAMSLRVLGNFLRWNRSDPSNFVRPIVKQLAQLNQRLDDAHEAFVQQHGG